MAHMNNNTSFSTAPAPTLGGDQLASIIDHASDAVISTDAEQTILLFNTSAEALFGYSRSEVLGQNLNMLIPESSRTSHQQHLTAFSAAGDITREMAGARDVSCQRKNGDMFLSAVSISKVTVNGEAIFTAMLRDVTDIRRMEEKLHSAFEFAHDSIFIVDPDTGRLLDVNKNAVNRLGYSKDELLNITVTDLAPPSELVGIQDIMHCLKKTGRGIFEHVHRSKNGAVTPVEISARLVSYGARKVYFKTVRDISERRRAEKKLAESEQRLAGILASVAEAVVSIDAADRIIVFNRAAQDIFGYAEEEVLGQPLTVLLPDRYATATAEDIQSFIDCNLGGVKSDRFTEVKVRRKSGETLITEVSVSELTVADHKIRTGVFRDITERREAQRLLQERAEKLERFNKLAVGRELVMVELKREVNALLARLGCEEKYVLPDPRRADARHDAPQADQ